MAQELKRILAAETAEKIEKQVLLRGWVKTRRDHGKLIFIDLRDRSGIVQVVFNQTVSKEAYEKAHQLRTEFVLEVTGRVKKRPENLVNPKIPTGTVEVEAKAVKILSRAESLPFDMGDEELNLELPTLLDNRSLTLRHPKVAAIFKVQETITQSFRKTLKDEGFTEIFVPTIVATATEGGAEVFPLQYFKHQAYLAQSPQFYKQIMIGVFERVFTVSHAYRAEPSVTTRHLTEYTSLDAELGFIDSWTELMDLTEKVITSIIRCIEVGNQKELVLLNPKLPKISSSIPRIKLKEAQEIILKRTKVNHRMEPDLTPEDERELCRWAEETNDSPFVFITHYPIKKRPFYTLPDPQNLDETLSFDLLGISEEWVTGGQRINDYQKLIENIKKWGNNPGDFEIYLQAFRYGMPPEGGFALGLERITRDILGLANIREASLFPRDMERIDGRLSRS